MTSPVRFDGRAPQSRMICSAKSRVRSTRLTSAFSLKPSALQFRLAARQLPIGRDVLFPSLRHNIRWQLGGGRRFVPAGGFQPVADELLVERRRIFSDCVLIGGPEARGIGRE